MPHVSATGRQEATGDMHAPNKVQSRYGESRSGSRRVGGRHPRAMSPVRNLTT